MPERPGVALGGTWLAAQGPRDARALCLLALELGFEGIVPAPATRPVRWEGLRKAVEDLPLRVPAIRVDPLHEEAEGSLASARQDQVELARARVRRAAALGEALGVRNLILETPRIALTGEIPAGTDLRDPTRSWSADGYGALRSRLQAVRGAYLDTICRNLHGLCLDLPEFRLCLTESPDLCAASAPDDLREILDDLQRHQLGYWHRPAVVARRSALAATSPGECLENLAKFLMGADLSDHDENGLQAVPGAGGVDYGLLAPYISTVSSRLPTVLEVDLACREGDLRQGRAFLGKFGL